MIIRKIGNLPTRLCPPPHDTSPNVNSAPGARSSGRKKIAWPLYFLFLALIGCGADDERFLKETEAEIKTVSADLRKLVQELRQIERERPKGDPAVPPVCRDREKAAQLDAASVQRCNEQLKAVQSAIQVHHQWREQNERRVLDLIHSFAAVRDRYQTLERKIRTQYRNALPQWVKGNDDWKFVESTFADPLIDEAIKIGRQAAESRSRGSGPSRDLRP